MRISDWSSDVCSSDLDPPTEQIDLGEVVAGLVEDMRGPSEAADVHLEAHVERDVIVFGGDEAIETIVEHLIDNAIGFSPPGGTVRVVVRAEIGRASCRERVCQYV